METVPMKRGLVSVMMPVYNAECFVTDALESLLRQEYPHWELVVIDDGSTDRSTDIIARYPDERIRIIHQENGGEAAARNTALTHLCGEYVAFLDPDDVFLPGHLRKTTSLLGKRRQYGGVYTDGCYIDQVGKHLGTLSGRRRGPFVGDVFEQVVRSSDVFGPPVCMVLRREPIVAHDLSYDIGVGLGTDWDFITRFAQFAEFGYIPEETCLYRIHSSNLTLLTDTENRKRGRMRCREKAIRLPRFQTCSEEVRSFSFYDLLINLLTGFPDRQRLVTEWPEFQALPEKAQARLYRLLASRGIVHQINSEYVDEWLRAARSLNPIDSRTLLLSWIYTIAPQLCQRLLQWRALMTRDRKPLTAFGALE